jgi:hypothetical protein
MVGHDGVVPENWGRTPEFAPKLGSGMQIVADRNPARRSFVLSCPNEGEIRLISLDGSLLHALIFLQVIKLLWIRSTTESIAMTQAR